MPQAPPRACRAGCPHFQPCPVHGKKRWAARQGSRQQRGYDAKHEKLRVQVLREEPICRECRIRPSRISDHIVPLSRGGRTVRANLQGLCDRCSATKTAREGANSRSGLASGHQARAKGEAPASPVARRVRDCLAPGGSP